MQKTELVITNRSGKRMPATLRTTEGAPKGYAVVLHGLGGWKEQGVVVAAADALARKGYTTLTFEAADGALAPDAAPLASTPTGFLEDLEDVMAYTQQQAWSTGACILAGHSLGALIATEYAAQHAEVDRIILIAPAISWKAYTRLFLPLGLWWLIRGVRRSPGPKGVRYLLGRRWLLDFIRYDSLRTAQKVSIPTLVISAEKDSLVGTPARQRQYAEQFAHHTHIVIPNGTHTFWKQEQSVADTITTWLS